MAVSKEFEVRQLLRAYRKGLVTDELFAEQMAEVYGTNGNGGGKTYSYNGRTYATERKMLLPLLDGYRAAEGLGAESLQAWIAACRIPCLRGGLRTVCEREAAHARLLEQRLAELGGECRAQIPEETRQTAIRRLSSPEITDLQKLQGVVKRTGAPDDGATELRRAVDLIEDDQETKQLLRTILDDETASTRWLRETCAALS